MLDNLLPKANFQSSMDDNTHRCYVGKDETEMTGVRDEQSKGILSFANTFPAA